jgi:hypothetical protein
MESHNKCKNCGEDIAIRNPTGNCDHLYYPENLPTKEDAGSWEKRFDKKFTVTSNAGTPLLRYTDAQGIKAFIAQEITTAVSQAENRTRDEVMGEINRVRETIEKFSGEGAVSNDMKSFAFITLNDLEKALSTIKSNTK